MFNDKRCFIYNKAFAEFCKSIDVTMIKNICLKILF